MKLPNPKQKALPGTVYTTYRHNGEAFDEAQEALTKKMASRRKKQ